MVTWPTWTKQRRNAGSIALAAAGFTEIGTVWPHGENRILAAIRGG
jgi:hypothetical protein